MQLYPLHDRSETVRSLHNIHVMRRARIAIVAMIAVAGVSVTAQAIDVGTLIQFQPNTTALAAEVNSNLDDIRTAVNSKQDQATVPGIDFASSPSSFPLNEATRSTVSTVNLTVPGPGVVEVSFSSSSFINHVLDASPFAGNGLNCQIEREGVAIGTSVRAWNLVGAEPTGGRTRTIATHAAFSETVAGTIAITVTCMKQGTVTANISRPVLIARFFEQRY